MAVNEGRSWTEVGGIVTDASTGGKVRDAFYGGHAEKVLLGAGTILYKFNEYPSLVAGDEAKAMGTDPRSAVGAAYFTQTLSPWWSPYLPYRHDAGWEQRKKLAVQLGVSIRELGRVTAAIKENWNSLRYLLVIELKTPAYGFFGGFSKMKRMDAGANSKRLTAPQPGHVGAFKPEGRGKTANLPGGGTQFYIPNLRPGNVKHWRVESLTGL